MTPQERQNALQTLKRLGVAEVQIIRNPQPDDVVVIEVDYDIRADEAAALKEQGVKAFGCKVVILGGGARLSPTMNPQEDAD